MAAFVQVGHEVRQPRTHDTAMPPNIIAGIVLTAIAGLLSLCAFMAFHAARRRGRRVGFLTTQPVCNPSQILPGAPPPHDIVRVTGVVDATDRPVISPLMQVPCAFYRFDFYRIEVSSESSSSRGGSRRVLIASMGDMATFTLRGADGSHCRVSTQWAQFKTQVYGEWQDSVLSTMPPEIYAISDVYAPRGLLEIVPNRIVTYTCLPLGATAYVRGVAKWGGGISGKQVELVDEKREIDGLNAGELVIADMPGSEVPSFTSGAIFLAAAVTAVCGALLAGIPALMSFAGKLFV